MIRAMERFDAIGRMKPSLETAPATAPPSPKVILLAKSEIRTIHVWQAGENRKSQDSGRRENDFASSIKSGQEPTSFTSVGSSTDSREPLLKWSLQRAMLLKFSTYKIRIWAIMLKNFHISWRQRGIKPTFRIGLPEC
jgi:hypothetical protein